MADYETGAGITEDEARRAHALEVVLAGWATQENTPSQVIVAAREIEGYLKGNGRSDG